MKMGFGIDCPKCGMIAFMLGCEHILFSDVLSCEMQCKNVRIITSRGISAVMTLLGQSLYIPHKHTQSYELFVDF